MATTRGCIALLLTAAFLAAADPVLRRGDHLALAGDSITEQLAYSRFVETYLVACRPDLELEIAQLGWAGESLPHFAGRYETATGWFRPQVITALYGMNDGGYQPPSAARTDAYGHALEQVAAKALAAGTRLVVVSPGAVDTGTFNQPAVSAADYNRALGLMRDRARDVAASSGLPFIDLHADLLSVMTAAKARLGERYPLLGTDGIHPGGAGHLILTWTILRGLGCDGDLGTITVPWQGEATAEGGHRVLARQDGVIDLESSRYLFSLDGATDAAQNPQSVLADLPFQHDLGRLRLVVSGLPTPRARITWGSAHGEFTAAELAVGVDLAGRIGTGVFTDAVRRVSKAVEAKQAFETVLVKQMLTGLVAARQTLADDPVIVSHEDAIVAALVARHAGLQAAVRTAVQPLRHRLVIEPISP